MIEAECPLVIEQRLVTMLLYHRHAHRQRLQDFHSASIGAIPQDLNIIMKRLFYILEIELLLENLYL